MTDRYTFDEEPNRCPEHGLALGSDFLCIVCRLQLKNAPVKAYKKLELGDTAIDLTTEEGRKLEYKLSKAFVNSKNNKTKAKAKKKDDYKPIHKDETQAPDPDDAEIDDDDD